MSIFSDIDSGELLDILDWAAEAIDTRPPDLQPEISPRLLRAIQDNARVILALKREQRT